MTKQVKRELEILIHHSISSTIIFQQCLYSQAELLATLVWSSGTLNNACHGAKRNQGKLVTGQVEPFINCLSRGQAEPKATACTAKRNFQQSLHGQAEPQANACRAKRNCQQSLHGQAEPFNCLHGQAEPLQRLCQVKRNRMRFGFRDWASCTLPGSSCRRPRPKGPAANDRGNLWHAAAAPGSLERV